MYAQSIMDFPELTSSPDEERISPINVGDLSLWSSLKRGLEAARPQHDRMASSGQKELLAPQ